MCDYILRNSARREDKNRYNFIPLTPGKSFRIGNNNGHSMRRRHNVYNVWQKSCYYQHTPEYELLPFIFNSEYDGAMSRE